MFAFVFESVGSGEWLVLLAVVLIVVGPRNLPAAARKMGQVMSKLRRAADEFKRQIMTMDEEMKRTADEIKRDYIDIPEDGSGDRSITDIADEPSDDAADYGDPDDAAHMSDYPEGYPDDDYYGDDSGMDADPAPQGEAAQQSEPASTETAAAAPEAVQAAPEKTNGQDTGNT